MERLDQDFFARDCLEVAPAMVGKLLFSASDDGPRCLRITETEAYRGTEDTACHASRGKTKRNQLLWYAPGTVYVYLCYGMHWMLNAITGEDGQPQGVLIRACEGYPGPGRLTKTLGIGGALNGGSFVTSEKLWLSDDGCRPKITLARRVGIGYASPEDQEKLWRFVMENPQK